MSEESERERTAEAKEKEQEAVIEEKPSASDNTITMALLVYWVLPVLVLAIVSRFAVDTTPPSTKPDPRPISLDLSKATTQPKKPSPISTSPPSSSPTSFSKLPTNYQDVVNQIRRRRRKWITSTGETTSTSSSKEQKKKPVEDKSPADLDPGQRRMIESIERLRDEYRADPNNVLKAIALADALRQKDLMIHDGGTGQAEALQLYQKAIDSTLETKHQLLEKGESTSHSSVSVRDEFLLDYSRKSVDGLLCALYTNMGKQYFMANMFERSVESHTRCIDDIEALYLDAVNSRGSTLIILGRYAEAARDLTTVIEHDDKRYFKDSFTGLAKVLTAKEDAVPQGWEAMIAIIEPLIEALEEQYESGSSASRQITAEALNRLHHVLFVYHDVKTNDTDTAWNHLSRGYRYKMAVLPSYNKSYEQQKVMQIQQIFNQGFWPAGVGSSSRVPIFIIGFVRSGSTLLERVLDAHPAIVGTGEDSVFNGQLDRIRNAIVQASMSGSSDALRDTVQSMADDVVNDMRTRWQVIDANTAKGSDDDNSTTQVDPERFADKMLTNYFNVGFIHLLFPKALILHVAREPMDTVFSAFKHEFPPGGLDYTSDFSSLADIYHAYRNVMQHWDEVLPGRVTHVRYEDMVHDMPGMAKAIIAAAGLPWDDDVLNFHKKKQAVNTLSTTQVRKGVYKHSLEAWKRYEKPLQPLVKLIGDQVKWDLKTTLPSYKPPAQTDEL